MALTDTVRDFYDTEPCVAERDITLSRAWLAYAAAPAASPLREGARALCAGCGTGREALGLMAAGLSVTGVDLSPASIAEARAASSQVTWRVADLQEPEAVADLEPFDLILCHAVADYVPDSAALLATLAGALSEGGLLLLSVNTDMHPRTRFREAWLALGGGATWTGSREDRARLKQCASITGPIPGLGALDELSEPLLRRDLFPPLAHHRAPNDWTALANTAGLHLRGDRRLRDLFARAADPRSLANHPLPALSQVAHSLLCPPSAMLLFGKRAPATVIVCGSSCPATDPSVPVASIPAATGDWDAPRSLTTVEDNVSRAIPITTRGLEILRLADGQTSLETIAEAMGTPWEPAHGDLLRLLHADLLRVSP